MAKHEVTYKIIIDDEGNTRKLEQMASSAENVTSSVKELDNGFDALAERVANAINKAMENARAMSSENNATQNLVQSQQELLAIQDKLQSAYESDVATLQKMETAYDALQNQINELKSSGSYDASSLEPLEREFEELKHSIQSAESAVSKSGAAYQQFSQQASAALGQLSSDEATKAEYSKKLTEEEIALRSMSLQEFQKLVEQERATRNQQKQSATESVSTEIDLSTMRAEAEKMSSQQIIGAIAQQRIAVRALEKDVASGNRSRQSELDTERAMLQVLSQVNAEKYKFMTQQRSIEGALGAEVQLNGKNTEMYRELVRILREVGTQYREISKLRLAESTGGTQWAGIISGVQGLMGAYTAANGVISLFVTSQEKLQKVQTKLQSTMAILMGMQQLANTLHSTSAFRVTTVTKVTELLTAANTKLAVSLGISTVAAKALMATLTLGLSVAITFAIAGISALVKKHREHAEEMKLSAEKQKEYAENIADSASKQMSAYKKLQAEWKTLRTEQEKNAWIKNNKSEFDKLEVSILSVVDAENLLVTNEQAFLQTIKQRAIAAASMDLAAEKYKLAIAKMLEADNYKTTKDDIRQAQTSSGTRVDAQVSQQRNVIARGQAGSKATRQAEFEKDLEAIISSRKAALSDAAKEFERQGDAFVGAAAKLNNEVVAALSAAGIDTKSEENQAAIKAAIQRKLKLVNESTRYILAQAKLEKSTVDSINKNILQIESDTQSEINASKEDSLDKRLEIIESAKRKELQKYEELKQAAVDALNSEALTSYNKELEIKGLAQVTELPAQLKKSYNDLSVNVQSAFDKMYVAIINNADVKAYLERLADMKSVVDKYKTTGEKIADVQKQSQKDLTALDQAWKAGLIKDQATYEAKKQLIIKESQDKISEILYEVAEKTDLAGLFSNLEGIPTAVLQNIKAKAQAVLDQQKNITDESKKLSVEAIAMIQKGISDVEANIAKNNPWKSLKTALKSYNDAVKAYNKQGATTDEQNAALLQMQSSAGQINEAFEQIRSTFEEIGDLATDVADIFGVDISNEVDHIVTGVNGIVTAMESFGKEGASVTDKIRGIQGIISAVSVGVGILIDLFNKRFNKVIVEANSQAGSLERTIKRISETKSSGDSLFTSDGFNTIKKQAEAALYAIDQIQGSIVKFNNDFQSRINEIANAKGTHNKIAGWVNGIMALLTGALVEIGLGVAGAIGSVNAAASIAIKSFKKENAEAINYFNNIQKYNLETVAGIEQALSDLETAYENTSGKLGKTYLEQVKTALEGAKEQLTALDASITELVGDLGANIQNAIVSAFKNSKGSVIDFVDYINESFESLIASQIFAGIFGDVFSSFGTDFKAAVMKGGEAVDQVYANLLKAIMSGIPTMFDALEKAKQSAAAAGLTIFSTNTDGTANSNYEATIEQYEATLAATKAELARMKSGSDQTLIDAYNSELNSLNAILDELNGSDFITRYREIEDQLINTTDPDFAAKLQKKLEALEAERAEALRSALEGYIEGANEMDFNQLYDALQQRLAELQAALESELTIDDQRAAKLEYIAQLEKLIADTRAEQEHYNTTLAGIDDQISGLQKLQDAESTTYEQYIEYQRQINDLQRQRNAITMGEGSLSYMQAELTMMNNELNLLTDLNTEYAKELIARRDALQLKIDEKNSQLTTTTEPAAGTLGFYQKQIDEANEKLKSFTADQTDEIAKWQADLAAAQASYTELYNILFPEEETEPALAEQISKNKELYEEYQNWVEQYGKESADAMYASLLANGDSYESYIKSVISGLESNLKALTEDEKTLLISLQDQLSDIEQEKADEAFTAWEDGFNDLKSSARDSIDYLDKLRQAKAALSTSGLSGKELSNAGVMIDQEMASTEKSILDDLLDKFQSTEEKRLDLVREYSEYETFLRERGYSAQADAAAEELQQQLSDLDKAAIESSALWEQLTGDTSEMSEDALIGMIAQVRGMIEQATDLTDQAKEELLAQLDEVEEDIKARKWDKAVQTLTDIETVLTSVNNALKDTGLLGDEASQTLDDIISAVGNIGSIVAGIASGNIVGVITGAIGLLTNLFSLLDFHGRKVDSQQKLINKNLSELKDLYNQLDRAVSKSIGTSTYNKQLELIENLRQQQQSLNDLITSEQTRKNPDEDLIATYQGEIQAIQNNIEDLYEAISAELLQTNVKTLAGSIADIMSDMATTTQDKLLSVRQTAQDVVKDMLRNWLQLRFLQTPLQAALDAMEEEMLANGPTKEMAEKFYAEAERVAKQYNDAFGTYADLFPSLTQVSSNQIASAWRSMSEEAGNAAVGQLTRQTISLIAQESYAEKQLEQTAAMHSVLTDMAVDVQAIRVNTEILKSIEKIMKDKNKSIGL